MTKRKKAKFKVGQKVMVRPVAVRIEKIFLQRGVEGYGATYVDVYYCDNGICYTESEIKPAVEPHREAGR